MEPRVLRMLASTLRTELQPQALLFESRSRLALELAASSFISHASTTRHEPLLLLLPLMVFR